MGEFFRISEIRVLERWYTLSLVFVFYFLPPGRNAMSVARKEKLHATAWHEHIYLQNLVPTLEVPSGNSLYFSPSTMHQVSDISPESDPQCRDLNFW